MTLLRATHTVAAMAKELYIIDGHAHIYAAYFAPMRGQLSSPTGEPHISDTSFQPFTQEV